MKYTQKWMVVPFDKNYSFKIHSSDQILRNNVLPSDVKSKLLNQLITKNILKRLPEKQLPVQVNNQEIQTDFEIQSLLKNLKNQVKDQEEQENDMPMEEDDIYDQKNDDEKTSDDYKNKLSYRKIKSAKRILETTLSQPFTKQSPKKTKKIDQTNTKPFFFTLEPEGPAQNTRQAVKLKLNTAQIGEGWLSYK